MSSLYFLIFTCFLFQYSNSLTIKECDYSTQDFKCYNGGVCIRIQINDTATMNICNCKAGFTGVQCEQETMPCSPDPCAPNGYCNSASDSDSQNSYFCRCKPGFTGRNCEENINECLNSKCQNGGLCIDGINSYECECPWPYSGRYCETFINVCENNSKCKNNASCIVEKRNNKISAKCICAQGFSGEDCSTKLDSCSSDPCLFGGKCRVSTGGDYECECPKGRTGKSCELMDICYLEKPCKNNASCIQIAPKSIQQHSNIDDDVVVNSNDFNRKLLIAKKFVCQCQPGYTGIQCEIDIKCPNGNCTENPKISTTTISTTTTTNSAIEHDNDKFNGSFVLILNLSPEEFRRRKSDIVKELSSQLNLLMLIEKDSNGNEMIYPYEYVSKASNKHFTPRQPTGKKLIWTKVYFIIIFPCVDENFQPLNDSSLCADTQLNSNGIFKFVSKLQESSILPTYVSNITYEAYGMKTNTKSDPDRNASPNNNPVVIIGIVIAVLLSIIILFGMIMRQNQIKQFIKAPVWFPPLANSEKHDMNMMNNNQSNNALLTNSSWSFKNIFKQPDSSPVSDNENPIKSDKPIKMRKIDPSQRDSSTPIFTTNTLSSSNSSQLTNLDYMSPSITPNSITPPPQTSSANKNFHDYYPSPPESVPDCYTNIKGPSGLTPLMCFIMNRKQQHSVIGFELIDTLITKGADVNAQSGSEGETALHMASRLGLVDICEKLINFGADFNIVDNYGRSALHTATGCNQIEVVKMLCHKLGEKLDVDLKTADKIGETALIYAVRFNFNELVKVLIGYNASVNATDNYGQSALHWSAKINNCQGAILLLENGANINLQDENEKTPLSVALDELNTDEIIQLLIKYQAFVSADDEKMLELKQQMNKNKNFSFKDNIAKHQLTKNANFMAIAQVEKNALKSKQNNASVDFTNNANQNRKRKLNIDNGSSKMQRKKSLPNETTIKLEKVESNSNLYSQVMQPNAVQMNAYNTQGNYPSSNQYNQAASYNNSQVYNQYNCYYQQQQQSFVPNAYQSYGNVRNSNYFVKDESEVYTNSAANQYDQIGNAANLNANFYSQNSQAGSTYEALFNSTYAAYF